MKPNSEEECECRKIERKIRAEVEKAEWFPQRMAHWSWYGTPACIEWKRMSVSLYTSERAWDEDRRWGAACKCPLCGELVCSDCERLRGRI